MFSENTPIPAIHIPKKGRDYKNHVRYVGPNRTAVETLCGIVTEVRNIAFEGACCDRCVNAFQDEVEKNRVAYLSTKEPVEVIRENKILARLQAHLERGRNEV